MQTSTSPVSRWSALIGQIRGLIYGAEFCGRHRRSEKDFTRQRVLTFPVVMLLVLEKTTKSIQRHLHAFFHQMCAELDSQCVSPGGWSQARGKLAHTAFIELNQAVLLPAFYAPEQLEHRRYWRGHRVLGVDSSLLRLPSHPKIFQTFGTVEVANHLGETGTRYAPARLSVLYDLLNEVGLDARLEPVRTGEVALAAAQLMHVLAGDVLLWDRGFTGFVLMARVMAEGKHFVGRCSQGSFAAAQELFRTNRARRNRRVKLTANPEQRAQLKELGLPSELVVRFVSVRLPTGELEVLVTSLLDERVYPTEEFLEVYHWRWGHETYYHLLKGRLDLENWSGHTVEAVKQDVQAAVLVSNLESLLSQEPQQELSAGDAARKYPAQVNRAVSYHALKERLLDLLWSERPIPEVLQEVQRWMQSNPVSVRRHRKALRRPQSLNRSYHYQRNIKKMVF